MRRVTVCGVPNLHAGRITDSVTLRAGTLPMKRKSTLNVKYLTDEELKKLFAVIRSVRDRAIFRLAYHRNHLIREGIQNNSLCRVAVARYHYRRHNHEDRKSDDHFEQSKSSFFISWHHCILYRNKEARTINLVHNK